MASAPGSSQVIRTVHSTEQQLLWERVRGQPCLLLGLSFSRCLWLLSPRTETVCPENLKHLLSGPLQKRSVDP